MEAVMFRKFSIQILALIILSGCTGGGTDIDAVPNITEDSWRYSEDGDVALTVVVPDKVFKKDDSVTARIGIKTKRSVTLQYLLFANDDEGDTIFSYPLPPKEISAGTETEFTATAHLFETPEGTYYFTALAFDEKGDLIVAKDAPVKVDTGEQRMEVVIDCFDSSDAKDSNLCVFDQDVTGYIRVELRNIYGGEAPQKPVVSGYFNYKDKKMDITFSGLVGEFKAPFEEDHYSGTITASAEGFETTTKEFEFGVINVSAVRINCDLDGECGPFESFETCPEDCESGIQDWFCDGEEDGICDPDCFVEEDPDCQCEPGSCPPELEEKALEDAIVKEITRNGGFGERYVALEGKVPEEERAAIWDRITDSRDKLWSLHGRVGEEDIDGLREEFNEVQSAVTQTEQELDRLESSV